MAKKLTMQVEKVCYNEVNVHEVERVIEEYFKIDNYECAPWEEWNTDEEHAISVDRTPLDAYAQEKVKKGNFSFMLRDFLCALAFYGIIEPGDYLVRS